MQFTAWQQSNMFILLVPISEIIFPNIFSNFAFVTSGYCISRHRSLQSNWKFLSLDRNWETCRISCARHETCVSEGFICSFEFCRFPGRTDVQIPFAESVAIAMIKKIIAPSHIKICRSFCALY